MAYFYIFQYYYSVLRKHFPNGIPIMDGSFKEGAGPFVDTAHKQFINDVANAVGLKIDMPDSSGTVLHILQIK